MILGKYNPLFKIWINNAKIKEPGLRSFEWQSWNLDVKDIWFDTLLWKSALLKNDAENLHSRNV